jgi:hypothetical protein
MLFVAFQFFTTLPLQLVFVGLAPRFANVMRIEAEVK